MTSMITTVNRSAAYDLLVVGDSDGYLRLFRFVWGNFSELIVKAVSDNHITSNI